ncbi:Eukaryotic translation initiation factor 3 subunit D [Forsythia ovata]|uniref:Eukaryotic translation initiation factor 3 subunit D n=1 Tax=Forsythia ovata TaxID=205694 RepID=A0ABD1X927_9LAMI
MSGGVNREPYSLTTSFSLLVFTRVKYFTQQVEELAAKHTPSLPRFLWLYLHALSILPSELKSWSQTILPHYLLVLEGAEAGTSIAKARTRNLLEVTVPNYYNWLWKGLEASTSIPKASTGILLENDVAKQERNINPPILPQHRRWKFHSQISPKNSSRQPLIAHHAFFHYPKKFNPNFYPSDFAFDFSGDDFFATIAANKDSSFRFVDTSTKSNHHHNANRPMFNPRWRFNPHN